MNGLEHINTIPELRKMITPEVPVCEKCNIERLRLTGRNSDVARCYECKKKLTEKLTWVKCPCGEEYSYLGISYIEIIGNSVSSDFKVDYKRTSERSICIKCHNEMLAKAWAEVKGNQKSDFENKRQDKYKEILDK